MENHETIYDEKIHPLMDQIISICKEHEIPMFAEFQYSEDGFCESMNAGTNIESHILFSYLDALTKCISDKGINIDSFMFAVMRHARECGHSSIILQRLGVDIKPKAAALGEVGE
jgi:hypothetical protein